MIKSTLILCVSALTLAACSSGGDNSTAPVNNPPPVAETPSDPPERTFNNVEITGDGEAGIDKTWTSLSEDGFTVHTINQTVSGNAQTRRYLRYLPSGFDRANTYPVVTILHGANVNAEITRQFDFNAELTALADIHQFVLIYGNAAAATPSADDDPFFANVGIWITPQTGGLDAELDYFSKIDTDLADDGIQVDSSKRFVGGVSNGGQMAAELMINRPNYYAATYLGVPAPWTFSSAASNTSVFLYYSVNDPLGLAFLPDYPGIMEDLVESIALSIGGDTSDLNAVSFSPLDDVIVEGEDYTGSVQVALDTSNSTLEEGKILSIQGDQQFRIMRSHQAGHGIPHPVQLEVESTVEAGIGFRNQDLNSSEEIIAFFSLFM